MHPPFSGSYALSMILGGAPSVRSLLPRLVGGDEEATVTRGVGIVANVELEPDVSIGRGRQVGVARGPDGIRASVPVFLDLQAVDPSTGSSRDVGIREARPRGIRRESTSPEGSRVDRCPWLGQQDADRLRREIHRCQSGLDRKSVV